MKLDPTTIWALCATAIALTLAGVMVGQSLPSSRQPTANAEASEPGAQPVVDGYHVPEWLNGSPTEWRSKPGDSNQGYAILFDYTHRELLIEECIHYGYFDTDANLPIDQAGFQCSRVLTSKLLKFTHTGVVVRTRDGTELEIGLEAFDRGERAVLALQFTDHSMQLIPGQLNELAQEIEKRAHIKAEFRQLFEFQQQHIRQQKAELAAVVDGQGVPRFSLPGAAPRESN